MTNEQAKSELMQIYMSLSEEKKKALDVAFKAMEQSMPTMVYPQVDGITPTVVAQADGEKTCGNCRNEDTYHCAECENKSDYEQAQADGEYISRTAIEYINAPIAPVIQGEEVHYEWVAFRKQIEQLPSVAIPSEHDGCKDCVYQDNPQDAMPCRECKQNYMDKWKAKSNKVGHWEVMYEPKNMVVCSECGKCAYLYNNRGSAYCPHCGNYKGE